MLIFLITCSFSLLIITEMKLLFLWFWKSLSLFILAKFFKPIPQKKKTTFAIVDPNPDMFVLDLPDLVLESILDKLSPDGLYRMAAVCASLRDKCSSDHLWEKAMRNKWGEVVGPAACEEWRCRADSRRSGQPGQFGLVDMWPLALIRSSFGGAFKRAASFPPADSAVACYLALESGRFWSRRRFRIARTIMLDLCCLATMLSSATIENQILSLPGDCLFGDVVVIGRGTEALVEGGRCKLFLL